MVAAYQPPFTISSAIVNLIAEISGRLGQLSADPRRLDLRLRRANRIRTVTGTLAIEGNTLSEDQISAILDGKSVIAPPREVLEARNAFSTYERLPSWIPSRQSHLLQAHRLMMKGLIDTAGSYRSEGVGVMAGDKLLHMAPPANQVPRLMTQLLRWLGKSKEHPLIASSIFHYEFEFIHPFADGNGRLGRLWQTLMLSRWNPLLGYLPVESMILQHQSAYYAAITRSTSETNSRALVEFMLAMIRDALDAADTRSTPQVAPQVTPQVAQLLSVLQSSMSRAELQTALGLKDRKSFRERYLNAAISAGLVELTIPDKPNSRLQRYRLTALGKRWRAV